MFQILNSHYFKIMGKDIPFGELGHSTQDFSFFLTQTISSSITSSQGDLKSSSSLVNKLLSLSSKSDYSLVEKVMSKISSKLNGKKENKTSIRKSKNQESSDKSKSFEVVSSNTQNVTSLSKGFEVI